LLLFSSIYAQSLTKPESLDALKQTLQGQMRHYFYGWPCSNNSGSSYQNANRVTINSLKYEYSQIIIDYTYEAEGGRQISNTRRISMKNYFVSIDNTIFESKQNYVDVEDKCENLINMAIPFSDDAKAAQERCLRIIDLFKKVCGKRPI
jgi:hypothetical protein